jgi:Tol biopolymer transport system component/DNA-binding winged helix-turn-helix (wHTH) protein
MAGTAQESPVTRFGLFEVDWQARELRKAGIRIKLQDQPFQILTALLERPGEVVTREELQKRLWPADTFVDFDLSLNSAVKKLRVALSDDSDNPRYIETLYRRGYRFIGPVNGVAKTGGTAVAPVLFLPEASPVASEEVTPRKTGVHHKKLLVLGCAAGIVMAVLAMRFGFPKPIRVLGYTQITHDSRFKVGIVTDGQRLYFSEIQGDRIAAAQVSSSGGDTAAVPAPFRNVAVADIAPDGSNLLVVNIKSPDELPALWVQPLPAGAPRLLTNLTPNAAAYSADGTEVAFATGSDIYLAKSDGTDVRKIGSAKPKAAGGPSARDAMVTSLRISPDGQRLRFTLTDSGSAAQFIWEMKRDGSGLHELLPAWNHSTFQCCGNWTRDGKYYLFQTSSRGRANIWALPDQPSWFGRQPEPVQLTNGPLQFRYPVPSKDGKKIFMVGSQPRAELLRLDPKLGWTPYLGGASAIDLAFSPDGQWVAYVSIPDLTLWRSRVDGSSPLQLTNSSLAAQLPRWSPDGQQITFMGRAETGLPGPALHPGLRFSAYVVSANAGDLHELIPGVDFGYDPHWSADGKSIVLSLADPLILSGPGVSIFDLKTKNISNLPESDNYFSPRPSPDGKYIASITRNSDRLVLFDLKTRRWSDLTTPPFGPVAYPNWSRDGDYIYFDTMFGDDSGIFRVRVADRKVEKIASMGGMQRYEANLGPWSGLAPDNLPLITRDISNQEIYALDWQAP